MTSRTNIVETEEVDRLLQVGRELKMTFEGSDGKLQEVFNSILCNQAKEEAKKKKYSKFRELARL